MKGKFILLSLSSAESFSLLLTDLYVTVSTCSSQVTVICDSETVRSDPFLAAFLDYMEQHGEVGGRHSAPFLVRYARPVSTRTCRTSCCQRGSSSLDRIPSRSRRKRRKLLPRRRSRRRKLLLKRLSKLLMYNPNISNIRLRKSNRSSRKRRTRLEGQSTRSGWTPSS